MAFEEIKSKGGMGNAIILFVEQVYQTMPLGAVREGKGKHFKRCNKIDHADC